MAVGKKRTYTPEQRARKSARARERRAELRAGPTGAAFREQHAAANRKAYAKAIRTPEGLAKVRAKRNRAARARAKRDRAAKHEAIRAQRDAEASASAMVDDALDAYRALLANLRHWQAQPNVPAPRIEGLTRSVAAAKRGVLEAQAYLLRVRSDRERK